MCLGLLKSSIGKKAVMAVSGLVLLGFVIAHLLGNLQIFLGQDWLNDYAAHLQGMPLLLWPARLFLLATLLVHMTVALQLAIENKKARPVPYACQATVQASLASRTMVLSGILIFLFLIYHLLHFTFGVTNPELFHQTDLKGRHDVYSMMVLSYQNYFISGVYLVAMWVLYLHLSHGAPRFLQSLGLTHEKTLQRVEKLGHLLAWLLFIGNSAIPLAVLGGLIKAPLGGP